MNEARTSLSPYRTWQGRLVAPWRTVWPIARTALTLTIRRKLFLVLLAFATFHFLFLSSAIYLKAQVRVNKPGLEKFVDVVLESMVGQGRTYLEFMFAQGSVTMLMLVFCGTAMLGDDFRNQATTFYLSRRIGRRHYITGKLAAMGSLVLLVTTVPTLVLYAQYGLLTDSTTYFRENLSILWGILGYGAIMAVVLSLVMFALTVWLPKTVPLVMTWACLFVMLPMASGILEHVHDQPYFALLRLWYDVRILGEWCFGTLESFHQAELLGPATWLVSGICVVSIAAAWPRIRGMRVIA